MNSEANKTVARRLIEEVWNQGNLALIDELIAPQYARHDPTTPNAGGPEGYRQMVMMYRAAFPDLHLHIDHQLAEGVMVATHWTLRGTHTGEFNGIAPSGKPVTLRGTTVSHIADG